MGSREVESRFGPLLALLDLALRWCTEGSGAQALAARVVYATACGSYMGSPAKSPPRGLFAAATSSALHQSASVPGPRRGDGARRQDRRVYRRDGQSRGLDRITLNIVIGRPPGRASGSQHRWCRPGCPRNTSANRRGISPGHRSRAAPFVSPQRVRPPSPPPDALNREDGGDPNVTPSHTANGNTKTSLAPGERLELST